MTAVVFAVDLGGTKLRSAVVRDGVMTTRRSVMTPRGIDEIVETVGKHFEAAQKVEHGLIDAVGISALGPIHPEVGIIRDAPTIPDFANVPIRDLVQRRIGRPVLVSNDANAATFGEWRRGAGRGVQNFCFITISTGIGAGMIVDGVLVHGHRGFAGELGRSRIRVRDELGLIQLEDRASGTAIAARANLLLCKEGNPALQEILDMRGRITSADVAELAEAGDSVCLELMADAATLIGERLADLTRLLDPAVIAIGGGVARAGDCLWRPMLGALASQFDDDQSQLPRVVPGELRDDAGLHGVSLLAAEAGHMNRRKDWKSVDSQSVI